MAKPFFPKEWETLTVEELATARARLAGFIEAVPDREKILREVNKTIDNNHTDHYGLEIGNFHVQDTNAVRLAACNQS